ncbi:helix-turn-helix transcriptional regulator [Hornefia butyriciproducens]|uniref:helix-turn-helix domain-containing protein n=1 Tax=Hornefia butyriciproducens TaxID=2652293 RepID=UPI002A91B268|nr:helix-turn-helix transcriptional regulator [Hornefia butyriciproducens]MDY5463212.1 helix-turn-helix transcriptional regulator [Hornefia butyriciproducens]
MTKFQIEFKRLREKQGLTQAELANALKIARSTVGMYEQGKREPDFETLESIADYFNVSMSVFLEGRQSDCDLYLKCYHKTAYHIVQKFLQLDKADQVRIEERIDMLLEDDKYQKDTTSTITA